MAPTKISSPVATPVVDLVRRRTDSLRRAPEYRRPFPASRGPAGERSRDRSAAGLSLRRFLQPRLDSVRPPRARKLSRSAAQRLRLSLAIQPPPWGRLKSAFSLRQLCREHAFRLLLPKCLQFIAHVLVGKRNNRSREQPGVFRARFTDGEGADRNAAGHLRGRQKRIEPLKLRLNWHTKDGQNCVRSD